MVAGHQEDKTEKNMKKICTLLELIRNLDSIDPKFSVCIAKESYNFFPDSQFLLVTEEEFEDDEESVGNFRYICDVYTIQDVLENLRQQKSEFNDIDALEAIEFYIKNDAFIVLDSEK